MLCLITDWVQQRWVGSSFVHLQPLLHHHHKYQDLMTRVLPTLNGVVGLNHLSACLNTSHSTIYCNTRGMQCIVGRVRPTRSLLPCAIAPTTVVIEDIGPWVTSTQELWVKLRYKWHQQMKLFLPSTVLYSSPHCCRNCVLLVATEDCAFAIACVLYFDFTKWRWNKKLADLRQDVCWRHTVQTCRQTYTLSSNNTGWTTTAGDSTSETIHSLRCYFSPLVSAWAEPWMTTSSCLLGPRAQGNTISSNFLICLTDWHFWPTQKNTGGS